MRNVLKIRRRTWLSWTGSGLAAIWTALEFGPARQHGWSVLLGAAPRRVARAQEGQSPHVLRVETEIAAPDGQRFDVSAYVLVRGAEAAIVDALTPGNAGRIGNVIQSFGLGWGAVRHVILTHYHFDHVGSLGEILDQAADATVYAGAPDIERISLPRDISPVGDRDEVFGLQIVSTPGHTDGHISVFDPLGSAVFIGDAAFNFGGSLSGSIPAFTADIAQANQSLKKLGAMSFERGLFAHGPPIPSGASAAIANLAATLDGGITQSKFAGQRTRNDSPLVSGRRPEQECCG